MSVLSFPILELKTLERLTESFADIDPSVRYSAELHRCLKQAISEHRQRHEFAAHPDAGQSLVKRLSLPPHLQGSCIIPVLYRRAAPEPILSDLVKRMRSLLLQLKSGSVPKDSVDDSESAAKKLSTNKKDIPQDATDWQFALAIDPPTVIDPFGQGSELIVFMGFAWRSAFQNQMYKNEVKGIRITSQDIELQLHQSICWEQLVKGKKVEYHEEFSDQLRVSPDVGRNPPSIPEGFDNYELKVFMYPASASTFEMLEHTLNETKSLFLPSNSLFDIHAAFSTTLVEDPKDSSKNALRVCVAKLWRTEEQYAEIAKKITEGSVPLSHFSVKLPTRSSVLVAMVKFLDSQVTFYQNECQSMALKLNSIEVKEEVSDMYYEELKQCFEEANKKLSVSREKIIKLETENKRLDAENKKLLQDLESLKTRLSRPDKLEDLSTNSANTLIKSTQPAIIAQQQSKSGAFDISSLLSPEVTKARSSSDVIASPRSFSLDASAPSRTKSGSGDPVASNRMKKMQDAISMLNDLDDSGNIPCAPSSTISSSTAPARETKVETNPESKAMTHFPATKPQYSGSKATLQLEEMVYSQLNRLETYIRPDQRRATNRDAAADSDVEVVRIGSPPGSGFPKTSSSKIIIDSQATHEDFMDQSIELKAQIIALEKRLDEEKYGRSQSDYKRRTVEGNLKQVQQKLEINAQSSGLYETLVAGLERDIEDLRKQLSEASQKSSPSESEPSIQKLTDELNQLRSELEEISSFKAKYEEAILNQKELLEEWELQCNHEDFFEVVRHEWIRLASMAETASDSNQQMVEQHAASKQELGKGASTIDTQAIQKSLDEKTAELAAVVSEKQKLAEKVGELSAALVKAKEASQQKSERHQKVVRDYEGKIARLTKTVESLKSQFERDQRDWQSIHESALSEVHSALSTSKQQISEMSANLVHREKEFSRLNEERRFSAMPSGDGSQTAATLRVLLQQEQSHSDKLHRQVVSLQSEVRNVKMMLDDERTYRQSLQKKLAESSNATQAPATTPRSSALSLSITPSLLTTPGITGASLASITSPRGTAAPSEGQQVQPANQTSSGQGASRGFQAPGSLRRGTVTSMQSTAPSVLSSRTVDANNPTGLRSNTHNPSSSTRMSLTPTQGASGGVSDARRQRSLLQTLEKSMQETERLKQSRALDSDAHSLSSTPPS